MTLVVDLIDHSDKLIRDNTDNPDSRPFLENSISIRGLSTEIFRVTFRRKHIVYKNYIKP